jgi:hypothetical protein
MNEFPKIQEVIIFFKNHPIIKSRRNFINFVAFHFDDLVVRITNVVS